MADAVAVLCDAFHEYPVMRYVLESGGSVYDAHLRTLVEFFVMARVFREEPVLAITDGNRVVAVAIVTLPRTGPAPEELNQLRERVWHELGTAARARYEAFGEACKAFHIDQPHHHLNMIGIRRSHVGLGFARPLLHAVHDLSRKDPSSCGVTLTTEDPQNISLYEHFGYQCTGNVTVSEKLRSWGFFRPRDAGN